MARTLTKKEATKRLAVTPEKHRILDHISIDQNKTLIEIADEAIGFYLHHKGADVSATNMQTRAN